MLLTEQDFLTQEIEECIKKHGNSPSSLMPILQQIQSHHSYISKLAIQILADKLNIFPTDIYSFASFYSFFNFEPKGKYIIRLCKTISCDLAGKDKIANQLTTELGIKFGETTPDGLFSLEWANCIGMCDRGPALLVNQKIFTRVTPAMIPDILKWVTQLDQSKVEDKYV
jgi:[NiFe] hydrogenase diaphorase moiety large subunit